MAFADEYNFDLLKNEAENLVLRELERQLAEYPQEICTCNECVVDMAAISLNAVRPLYRFSILGTLYTAQAENEAVYAERLRQAVAQAIERVRQNPSHD